MARGLLRVIGGSAGGLELLPPKSRATRPTSSRLREALFSMLEAADTDFTEVLDLYAGSGALGIEALSRGDGRATFVEADRTTAALVRENLRRTGFRDRGDVVTGRVGRWRPPPGAAYTCVLADPPYDDADPWADIERSVEGSLAPGATVVVEHAARREPRPALAGRPLWRDRRQGDGAVAVYRAQPDGEARAEREREEPG